MSTDTPSAPRPNPIAANRPFPANPATGPSIRCPLYRIICYTTQCGKHGKETTNPRYAHRGSMKMEQNNSGFSEAYERLRHNLLVVREGTAPPDEHALQCVWYDQRYSPEGLRSVEGHALRVLSPGWWNHQEGPDFKGAQIEFNGVLFSGDVEIHWTASGWNAHGHQRDKRYDDVILHVIFGEKPNPASACTSAGRQVPTLWLNPKRCGNISPTATRTFPSDEPPPCPETSTGQCAGWAGQGNRHTLESFIDLAGDWRILNKARLLNERMDVTGANQSIYESIMYACGFSHFKHHFRAIARHLPYDRARQLAQQDPLLLECAFFQIAGLLPAALAPETMPIPHFERLHALRREHLEGLRSLPLEWRKNGIRPNNYPERRLSGAAMFLAKTASMGIEESLTEIWRASLSFKQRQKQFESLFPPPVGFWATHCAWTAKPTARSNALLGPGRIRSIVGNVFIPAALAAARKQRDRLMEEKIYDFFRALPPEPDNHIVNAMLPRLFGTAMPPKTGFRKQQGLLQIHEDWCATNPSCRHCAALRYLESLNTPLNLTTEHV